MRSVEFSAHPGLFAVFSGREDGDMAATASPEAAAAARTALARAQGADPARLRFMRQIHSADVAPVGPEAGAGSDEVPTADAIVDASGELIPAVLTADCVPVVFAATGSVPDAAGPGPARTLLAAAHAGRPGLLAGVLEHTVAALRERGARDIEAWIGPAVCGACYEVPQDMQDAAEAMDPGISATTSWGTPSLDLPRSAAARLRRAGVSVRDIGVCTLHGSHNFSYRGGDAVARNVSLVLRRDPDAQGGQYMEQGTGSPDGRGEA